MWIKPACSSPAVQCAEGAQQMVGFMGLVFVSSPSGGERERAILRFMCSEHELPFFPSEDARGGQRMVAEP